MVHFIASCGLFDADYKWTRCAIQRVEGEAGARICTMDTAIEGGTNTECNL